MRRLFHFTKGRAYYRRKAWYAINNSVAGLIALAIVVYRMNKFEQDVMKDELIAVRYIEQVSC